MNATIENVAAALLKSGVYRNQSGAKTDAAKIAPMLVGGDWTASVERFLRARDFRYHEVASVIASLSIAEVA